MPDIEMLSLLSKEFDVSINELISGQRLLAEDFQKAADSNLVTALNNSTFTFKEKIAFFKKNWLREHVASYILAFILWKFQNVDPPVLGAVGGMLALLFYVLLYNRMMAYVENHAYRATPNKESET